MSGFKRLGFVITLATVLWAFNFERAHADEQTAGTGLSRKGRVETGSQCLVNPETLGLKSGH
jgi:hypothetical protein